MDDVERVLFLNVKNREFVETRGAAKTFFEKRARGRLRTIVVALLVFGLPAGAYMVLQSALLWRLAVKGKHVIARIAHKEIVRDPETGDLCRIAYQFNASGRNYEVQDDLPPRLCNELSIGSTTEVIYDARRPQLAKVQSSFLPSVSMLIVIILCEVYGFFAFRRRMQTLRQEQKLALTGILLKGDILEKTYIDSSSSKIRVTYRFQIPDNGKTVAVAIGDRECSNDRISRGPWQPELDRIMLLYLSETQFVVL